MDIFNASNHSRVKDLINILQTDPDSVHSLDCNGRTPLMALCQSKHPRVDVLKILIDHGADFQCTHYTGTPLHYASKYGHIDIVEELLSRGANVEEMDDLGYTPLHLACFHRHMKISLLLIEAGSNIYTISKYNKTPLQLLEQVQPEYVPILQAAYNNYQNNHDYILK